MDFKDEIKQIGERISKLKSQIQTEEATKNAFIMPFILALGYDVFNPLEVVPEFVADIGTKKGEKIDYAIFKDGNPAILIECKHWGQNLNLYDGQLLRYFHVSKAKFGVLTNGIEYRFYSDLDEPNKMDEKPFLSFRIDEIKDVQTEELKKFHKSYFDVESIVNTASDLKYTNELKSLLHKELSNPSAEFVKHLTKQVYSGMITSKVMDSFTELTRRSINQYISEIYTDRLKQALSKETEKSNSEQLEELSDDPVISTAKGVETTEEELEAFMVIKSILRQKINVSRIYYRDAQSYFAILLDDNNRKTVCRLYFNKKKSIGLFDTEKRETKYEIETIDDLFQYGDMLLETLGLYEFVTNVTD